MRLSDEFEVEVARDRQLWSQSYSPGRCRGPSCRTAGRCTTGAARRCASTPIRRSSARSGSARRRSTAWRAPRPICFRGLEIRWSCDPVAAAPRGRPGRGQAAFSGRARRFPVGEPRRARDADAAAVRRPGRFRRKAAASNGRSPGPRTRKTASATPTATPSRPRKAAPTRRGCATPCCAASRAMPSSSATAASPRRPAKT